jgi:hypothetical protein
MGPIAWVLLHTDLPALLKYPVLAVSTWVASNLLVYAYTKAVEKWIAGPFRLRASVGWRKSACEAKAWE